MNFGEALEIVKEGKKVAREGWNGRGIYVALYTAPKEAVCEMLPFLVINTAGLETSNDKAPRGVVPWLPSQTDLLANDWKHFNFKGVN